MAAAWAFRPKACGQKTTKAAQPVGGNEADDLKALGHIELAVLTGQFTRDERAGVDLVLVGTVNTNAVNKYVADLEAKEGKEIRYVVMKPSDYKYRQQIRDRFVTELAAKKQVLIDQLGE